MNLEQNLLKSFMFSTGFLLCSRRDRQLPIKPRAMHVQTEKQ